MTVDPENPSAAEVTAAVHELANRPRHPHTLSLAFGGELSISEHDGDYRLHVHVENGQFSIALTGLDVWGIRQLTGEIVRGRADEMVAEVAS